jgi:hypothetical protein
MQFIYSEVVLCVGRVDSKKEIRNFRKKLFRSKFCEAFFCWFFGEKLDKTSRETLGSSQKV